MSTSSYNDTQVLVRSDAASLWLDAVALVSENGEVVGPVASEGSPSRGIATREVRGIKMVLTEPRARYVASQARPLNSAFCIGNFLYFLSGSSDVEPLRYYNPNAEKFSDDGKTLHGTYAPRLDGQFYLVGRLLRTDPATRRAVMCIMNTELDLFDLQTSKDIPCPTSLQWFVRDGALELHVSFRSQNVAMLFPYDVFLLTMIQEWFAAELGLRCGAYVQYVGSLHFYDREQDLAEKILREGPSTVTMPPMPRLGSKIKKLLAAEKAWRLWGLSDPAKSSGRRRPAPWEQRTDSPYWRGIVDMLADIAVRKRSGTDVIRDDSMFRTFRDGTPS